MPDDLPSASRSTPLPGGDVGDVTDDHGPGEPDDRDHDGEATAATEHTEFALDEWSVEDRALLDRLLVGEEIPHTWQGATLIVATPSQFTVDELIDVVEAGPDASAEAGWVDGDEAALVDLDDDGLDDDVDAQDVLGSTFVAADRLRKRASDPEGVLALVEVHATMVSMRLPFGFEEDVWADLVQAVSVLAAGLTAAEGSEASLGDEEVEDLAEDLRARLRPLV